MTVYKYFPRRMFIFYLHTVAKLTRPHAKEVAATAIELYWQVGDLTQINPDVMRTLHEKPRYIEAITYFRQFDEFMQKAKRRRGRVINFQELAERHNTSSNRVKKVFAYYLVKIRRDRADFIGSDGYNLRYVMPQKDYEDFERYLVECLAEDDRRYHTYAEFISQGD